MTVLRYKIILYFAILLLIIAGFFMQRNNPEYKLMPDDKFAEGGHYEQQRI